MVSNRFTRAYNTADFDLRAIEESRRPTQVWDERTHKPRNIRFLAPHYKAGLRRMRFARIQEEDEEADEPVSKVHECSKSDFDLPEKDLEGGLLPPLVPEPLRPAKRD